jgi:hypothetical protein
MTDDREPANEAALDALLREAFRRGPDESPPAGFAEAVMELRHQQPPARRARAWRWPALVAAAAAALLALVLGHRGPGADEELLATARQSIRLDTRGVAVMEAGGALERRDGRWTQRAGNVFYRIDRGGEFTLRTAAGEVVVLGTCFRVEVDPMKLSPQTKVGFLAGATLATAVVVTVYEGRVRLANGSGRQDLEAGEQGTLATGQAPGRLSGAAGSLAAAASAARPPALVTATAPDIEELRAKVAAQDKELATLRQDQKMKKGGSGPWVDVPHDELVARAGRCELRWDEPEINGYQVKPLDEKNGWARTAGLSDTERDAYNEALKELQASVAGQLRQLFLEMTGDAQMAEKLPIAGLMGLILEKTPDPARTEARSRLSKERAGLLPPPTDPGKTPVIERALRIMTGAGDELEKKLGERVGADRARTLRRVRDGWPGGRSSMNGCPS